MRRDKFETTKKMILIFNIHHIELSPQFTNKLLKIFLLRSKKLYILTTQSNKKNGLNLGKLPKRLPVKRKKVYRSLVKTKCYKRIFL